MEKFNTPEDYRDNLASYLKDVKETDPEKAQKILEEEKGTDRYKNAESKHVEQRVEDRANAKINREYNEETIVDLKEDIKEDPLGFSGYDTDYKNLFFALYNKYNGDGDKAIQEILTLIDEASHDQSQADAIEMNKIKMKKDLEVLLGKVKEEENENKEEEKNISQEDKEWRLYDPTGDIRRYQSYCSSAARSTSLIKGNEEDVAWNAKESQRYAERMLESPSFINQVKEFKKTTFGQNNSSYLNDEHFS